MYDHIVELVGRHGVRFSDALPRLDISIAQFDD